MPSIERFLVDQPIAKPPTKQPETKAKSRASEPALLLKAKSARRMTRTPIRVRHAHKRFIFALAVPKAEVKMRMEPLTGPLTMGNAQFNEAL